MDLIKIGKYIAGKRKALGLTQVQVAEKLGMSDKSVSKWERGICLPDVSVYMDLCEILGISLNEFIAGEDLEQNIIVEKSEENLIQVTKDGSVRKRKLIKAIVVLICILVVVTGALLCLIFSDGQSPVNYVEPLAEDSAEMNIAKVLSDVDGAYLYNYVINEEFNKMCIDLSVYRRGVLEKKETIGEVNFEASSVTDGMIAIVPYFDEFKVKLIVAGSGMKYATEFDILEDVDDRQWYGRSATGINDRISISKDTDQGIMALVYGRNGLRMIPITDIANGADQDKNDFMYYISVRFGSNHMD